MRTERTWQTRRARSRRGGRELTRRSGGRADGGGKGADRGSVDSNGRADRAHEAQTGGRGVDGLSDERADLAVRGETGTVGRTGRTSGLDSQGLQSADSWSGGRRSRLGSRRWN